MRPTLNQPKFVKHNDSGKGNDLAYVVSTMQGWRANQEDRYIAHCILKSLPNWSFFGVFDGHGGQSVAEACSNFLLDEVLNQEFIKDLAESKSEECVNLMEDAIKSAFMDFDRKLKLKCSQPRDHECGSTSACVLISPTHYYFINCGDSRVLLWRGGSVHFATEDHKPENPEENERVINAGGCVVLGRISGILAVSRALGDFAFKGLKDKGPTDQLVSPEPDVTAVERNSQDDQFLILASDGIFNYLNNFDLCYLVSKKLNFKQSIQRVCNDVVDFGLKTGSRDNITMILVDLPSCPKPQNEVADEAGSSTSSYQ